MQSGMISSELRIGIFACSAPTFWSRHISFRLTYSRESSDGGHQHAEEEPLLVRPEQRLQVQALENEVDYNEAIIEEREREIQNVSQGIAELNGVFNELGRIIGQQGSLIVPSVFETGGVLLMVCVQHRDQRLEHWRQRAKRRRGAYESERAPEAIAQAAVHRPPSPRSAHDRHPVNRLRRLKAGMGYVTAVWGNQRIVMLVDGFAFWRFADYRVVSRGFSTQRAGLFSCSI
ncbi:MAG: hypothetical protein BJ554DRAFT_2138 [Olpidium bornovanus]|uniref:t-SNARE coiled-coil homology domain-containing protein n=1 Tax=Olpidium bornovanus TaxID=278681 RepID=A0A8H7ZR99_9FUNG|nr:MAG: hypothetical protein BJ554DRAFT_2138 [Olpidium bornovanus]